MSELADFLHKLIDAIDRPADHPAAELHQEVDEALAGTNSEPESPSTSELTPQDEAPAPSPEAETVAPEPPAEDSAEVVEPDLAAQPPPVDG